MWEVLETAQALSEKSLHVKLDKHAIINFARKLDKEQVVIPSWNTLYHFDGKEEELVAYLLVLDSINFCFWPALGNPKWEVEYQSGKTVRLLRARRLAEKSTRIRSAPYECSVSCKTFFKGIQKNFGR